MKLRAESNFGNRKEYHCEITDELDKLCGFSDNSDEDDMFKCIFRNYILDTRDVWGNCLAIRIPGRTTGSIYVDENNIIIKCIIDEDCIGDSTKSPYHYPSNTNEILKKYISVKLELEG